MNNLNPTSPAINASDVSSAAPGGPRPAGLVSGPAPATPVRRCAVYYDGFNVFHAVKALGRRNNLATGEKHLRWLNLWKLSERLIDTKHEKLEKVVWCSAIYTKNPQKGMRHGLYKKALDSVGVQCVLGHFITEPIHHPGTGALLGDKQTEKTSDVSLALRVICDAVDDLYDKAFLVTADTDQAVTAEMFRNRFDAVGKEIISVAMFGHRHHQHILRHCHGSSMITEDMVSSSLFPATVLKDGKWVVDRPPHYAPPAAKKVVVSV